MVCTYTETASFLRLPGGFPAIFGAERHLEILNALPTLVGGERVLVADEMPTHLAPPENRRPVFVDLDTALGTALGRVT
jgi:hypothetical protein